MPEEEGPELGETGAPQVKSSQTLALQFHAAGPLPIFGALPPGSEHTSSRSPVQFQGMSARDRQSALGHAHCPWGRPWLKRTGRTGRKPLLSDRQFWAGADVQQDQVGGLSRGVRDQKLHRTIGL